MTSGTNDFVRKTLPSSVLALDVAAAGETSAAANKYVYNSWRGANHTVNTLCLAPHFEKLKEETGGEAEWDLVVGAQSARGPGTPEAVGNGIVDSGIVIAPYQARPIAAANTIFSNSLLGDHAMAAAGAMKETVMLGCPECLDECRKMNAVGFTGYAASPYVFMCSKEVNAPGDLKGLKVRSSGGGVSISKIAGATPYCC